jgi:tetratricopeptide (TPR) repeat protein
MTFAIGLSVLHLSGCGPTGDLATLPPPGKPSARPDTLHPMAVRQMIEGSVQEMRGDYARAVLEYQDALRYAKSAAIYSAISRSYSALGKHALAIEAGRVAVAREGSNLEYRRTLAESYLAAFQPDSAIVQYEEIVRRDSGDASAWVNLARLTSMRRPLRALELYEQILARFGPQWGILLQMAELYNKQGQFDKAAAALDQMKMLDPGNQPLQRTLAQTYLRAGNPDEALRIIQGLLELDPENLELVADCGEIYLRKKEYARADTCFGRILSRDSVSSDAKVRIGQLYFDGIEKDSTLLPSAQSIFQRLERAYPRDWRPHWFLGAIASMQRADSLSALHFRKVTELAPWNPDGWFYLASSYFAANDFQMMARILEDGRKHAPGDFRVNLFLGVAYNRLNRPQEAVTALEQAREINPRDVDAIAELAMVLEGLKRHAESDSLYELGLRLKPDAHLILNNYAYSLSERGLQLKRALRMVTAALEAQPENSSYLDTKGWVYYQLGEYRDAEQFILRSIEKGGGSAVVFDHLGDIYFRLGDSEKARANWQKALDLDPANAAFREKLDRKD